MMGLMSKLMIACDKATFLISKNMEKKLTLKENISLRMHLISCNICRKYEDDIISLNQYLKAHQNSFHKLEIDQRLRIYEKINLESKK